MEGTIILKEIRTTTAIIIMEIIIINTSLNVVF